MSTHYLNRWASDFRTGLQFFILIFILHSLPKLVGIQLWKTSVEYETQHQVPFDQDMLQTLTQSIKLASWLSLAKLHLQYAMDEAYSIVCSVN